jgi:energy-coupling factor transport system ATP-binding protein
VTIAEGRGSSRPSDAVEGRSGGTAAAQPPAIEATDLGWTYAGRSMPAIGGLTFRLEPGRVLLVLGPSGSGKSTLARALAGLVPHVLPGTMSGRLVVGDLDVASTPARLLGERIGLVFQDPDSQLVMSRVDDEVAFGLENRGWPLDAMHRRVPEALARVGLAGFGARSTKTLSGGEKQRLAIADVLAAGPGLLVLDEPTANLDPPGMQSTFEHLADLARRREHTIVLVEHRLEAALPLADYVLLIDDSGRQLAFEPAGSVGRDAIDLLERSGAWLPRAWGGLGPSRRAVMGSGPVAGTMAIDAESLRIEYPSEDGASNVVLESVSVSVAGGERLALVGPNGAGKSSLLFALAGLLRPAAGHVLVRTAFDGGKPGAETMRDPSRLATLEIADTIGMVFGDPELGFVASTVRGEVEATARALGPERRSRGHSGAPVAATASPRAVSTDDVLTHFGLAGLAGEDPFRLSQGEQRRLSLAALALRPPAVLLLDEPTFGLDRRGTEAVLELLDDLRRAGQAQILATHDPRLLPACDRVLALDAGRTVFDGEVAEFQAAPPYTPAAPWRGETEPPALDSPGASVTGREAAPRADADAGTATTFATVETDLDGLQPPAADSQ